MTEQPDADIRRIADDGTQENAEAGTDGGRSSRGPSLSIGGQQEPGGVVPPYDDRQTSGTVATDGSDYIGGARVGGAGGMVESSRDSASPDPQDTPRGPVATPAAEYPAEDEPDADEHDLDRRNDPGVGPAHITGVPRGEDPSK